jgi:Mrp family chromosome partitioning ATPase
MGRVLETLKQAEARRGARPGHVPQTEQSGDMAQPPCGDPAEGAADMPFIEVGPNRSIEASADVFPQRPAPVTPPAQAPTLLADPSADDAVSRRYRVLLAAVCQKLQAATALALLFTAAGIGAGTTTVLLNLAAVAAQSERRRVLVIDGNLRRPAVAGRLGLRPAPGLREVLGGTATLEQAVQATGQGNLFALTAGLVVGGTGPRFVAETLRSVLRQARQRFHLILVDGAPWDAAEALRHRRGDATAAGCDAVFVVVPEGEEESPQVDALLQVIPEQGGHLGGCIVAGR